MAPVGGFAPATCAPMAVQYAPAIAWATWQIGSFAPGGCGSGAPGVGSMAPGHFGSAAQPGCMAPMDIGSMAQVDVGSTAPGGNALQGSGSFAPVDVGSMAPGQGPGSFAPGDGSVAPADRGSVAPVDGSLAPDAGSSAPAAFPYTDIRLREAPATATGGPNSGAAAPVGVSDGSGAAAAAPPESSAAAEGEKRLYAQARHGRAGRGGAFGSHDMRRAVFVERSLQREFFSRGGGAGSWQESRTTWTTHSWSPPSDDWADWVQDSATGWWSRK